MIGWESLEFHELADLLPMLCEEELSRLADRIEADGFDPSHPIVLFEGKILDGRNRWMACDCLRMEGRLSSPPPFRQFEGENALSFVLRENIHRRHLDEGQRAVIADKVARMKPGQQSVNASIEAFTQAEAAEMFAVSRSSVQRAASVREKAPELLSLVSQGTVSLHKAASQAKKRSRPQPPAPRPIPAGKFTVLYADPPWRYDHMRVDAWAVENTYPTMTLEELCAMAPKVDSCCTDETVLFLWTTSTKLPWGVQLMDAWGFEFKSSMVWVKHLNAAGMGYWARIGHELLLIGARKKATPPPVERRFPSVIEAPKGEHSEKPEEMRCIIERMFPDATRLELFARTAPEGWAVWGNEAP